MIKAFTFDAKNKTFSTMSAIAEGETVFIDAVPYVIKYVIKTYLNYMPIYTAYFGANFNERNVLENSWYVAQVKEVRV